MSDPKTTAGPREQRPEQAESSEGVRAIHIDLGKGKRRYSKGLKTLQRTQRGLAKATARWTNAVAAGVSSFEKRSDNSSHKKRDGAIKDALENWARAMGKTIRESSGVPRALVAPIDTKRTRRQMKKLARMLSAAFRLR